MIEVFGDLWTMAGAKAITTNGAVRKDGACVMGRGCAKQAARRYPDFPYDLGEHIKAAGNHVVYFPLYDLFSFPVKHHWSEMADPELIVRSAYELDDACMQFGIDTVFLPRPGCGNGGLEWKDVKPLIEPILVGPRFRIVDYPKSMKP